MCKYEDVLGMKKYTPINAQTYGMPSQESVLVAPTVSSHNSSKLFHSYINLLSYQKPKKSKKNQIRQNPSHKLIEIK